MDSVPALLYTHGCQKEGFTQLSTEESGLKANSDGCGHVTEYVMNNNPNILKFSKSLLDVIDIKSNYFTENSRLLKDINALNELYCRQEKRAKCKLCEAQLPDDVYFSSHGVEYKRCRNCTHINGSYHDGEAYAKAVYLESGYEDSYDDELISAYKNRIDKIYAPKAQFLLDSLTRIEGGISPHAFLDVGAGAGHMVKAMTNLGVDCLGLEVSQRQVAFANRMLGKELLEFRIFDQIANDISQTARDVVIFIGVLEHLTDLPGILTSVSNNPSIRYMYFSVPCYSLSCVWEAIFPDIFCRQLGGGHTHLFTKKSLEWMYEHYKFTPVAVWDFGADVLDLLRSSLVRLHAAGASQAMQEEVADFFMTQGDSLQSVVDKSGFASETHVLVARERA